MTRVSANSSRDFFKKRDARSSLVFQFTEIMNRVARFLIRSPDVVINLNVRETKSCNFFHFQSRSSTSRNLIRRKQIYIFPFFLFLSFTQFAGKYLGKFSKETPRRWTLLRESFLVEFSKSLGQLPIVIYNLAMHFKSLVHLENRLGPLC